LVSEINAADDDDDNCIFDDNLTGCGC